MQPELKSEKVPPLQMNYEAKNLKKQEPYEFWVTASTTVGEGQPSRTITVTPSTRGKLYIQFSYYSTMSFLNFKVYQQIKFHLFPEN